MNRKRVTREDVAKRAGVSTAVVSYVVNDGPRPVSPETRAKVEQAIEELGYYPNEIARSLKLQRSQTIGLIVPNVNNPVYSEVVHSMECICIEEGYLVLLCNSGRDPQREERYVHMLRAKKVDGVVIMPSHRPMRLVEILKRSHVPVIVLEHDLPDTHCIAADDLQGGRLATEHLIELGHRRIGLIRREPSSATSSQRLVGYRQALEAAGIPYDPSLVVETQAGHEAGYQAMQHLLALPEPPTAVFTHNDVLALGAMHAIRAAGLSIPDDISVVGYDNTVSCAYLNPPLTTVNYPKAEMGRQAALEILQLAQGRDDLQTRTIILPTELVVRHSTAPPPSSTGL